jgi:hypothetical protein
MVATSSACFKITGTGVRRIDWQFHVAIRGPQAVEDMSGVHQDMPEFDDEELVRKLLLLCGICCSPGLSVLMCMHAAACDYVMCRLV